VSWILRICLLCCLMNDYSVYSSFTILHMHLVAKPISKGISGNLPPPPLGKPLPNPTITAISWPPPWILNPFFRMGAVHFFYCWARLLSHDDMFLGCVFLIFGKILSEGNFHFQAIHNRKAGIFCDFQWFMTILHVHVWCSLIWRVQI